MNCCQYLKYSVFQTSITKGIKEGKRRRKKEEGSKKAWEIGKTG